MTRINNLASERILPAPSKFTATEGDWLRIAANTTFFIPALGCAGKVARLAQAWWKAAIKISETETDAHLAPDAYQIKTGKNDVTIQASDEGGLLNALKTLRQLAEPERTAECEHYILPPAIVEDAPAFAFRGLHICWFPENEAWQIEKLVRTAAYCKFNYVVLEFWGTFPFESHPELYWKDHHADRGYLKNLIKTAAECGLTIIPQFNILGHGALARMASGKHVVLDFHPEFEPLFEPDGWCWCLSNPATRELLSDAVLELHEFFDRPKFFHIGCDEPDNMFSCAACRAKEPRELLFDHIQFFHKLLAKTGTHPIIWHDMFLTRDDPRWNGYVANGRPEHQLGNLLEILPKDTIIADWQYGYPKVNNIEPAWPTLPFFKNKGFNTIACPWDLPDNIKSFGAAAKNHGLFGMLITSWHHQNGLPLNDIFRLGASAAWGNYGGSPMIFNRLSRHITWDMNLEQYEQTGSIQYQIPPHGFDHRATIY